MPFRLPSGSELSKEEFAIINLSATKNWVVEGGPGTGKTVMALYRAGQVRNGKVLLLVFNRPLYSFIASAFCKEKYANCEICTYHSWLQHFYGQHFNRQAPTLTSGYDFNWEEIKADFKKIPIIYEHIIIDEAQDFPKELIEILSNIAHYMTCFIDPNQTIVNTGTNVVTTLRALCELSPYCLTKNFRNTKEIRDFSLLFGDSPNDAYSELNGIKPRVKVINLDKSQPNFEEQNQEIAKIIRQNKGIEIGIIVPGNKQARHLYNSLEEQQLGVDIQLYDRGSNKTVIDWKKIGTKILTYETAKGLEFDIVILPNFDRILIGTADKQTIKNKIYVASSRALRELYVFAFNDTISSNVFFDTMSPLKSNTDKWR